MAKFGVVIVALCVCGVLSAAVHQPIDGEFSVADKDHRVEIDAGSGDEIVHIPATHHHNNSHKNTHHKKIDRDHVLHVTKPATETWNEGSGFGSGDHTVEMITETIDKDEVHRAIGLMYGCGPNELDKLRTDDVIDILLEVVSTNVKQDRLLEQLFSIVQKKRSVPTETKHRRLSRDRLLMEHVAFMHRVLVGL